MQGIQMKNMQAGVGETNQNCFGIPQLSHHHGQCSGLFPGSYSQENRLHSRQNRRQVVAMSLLGT